MKTSSLLFLTLLFALATMTFAEFKTQTQEEKTRADGAIVKSETQHQYGVEKDGVVKSADSVKTEVDPKGRMNKLLVERHSESEVKPNGDYAKSETIHHANGTDEVVDSTKVTKKHWTNRGTNATTSYSKTVDPKGLGNKRTETTTESVDSAQGKDSTKTVTKTVDGSTVSEEMNVLPK